MISLEDKGLRGNAIRNGTCYISISSSCLFIIHHPCAFALFFLDKFTGGDGSVKALIWEGVRPIIEEWVGQKIEATSLYGIRVYHQDAVLATHVDRLPLVSSCIIQVCVLHDPFKLVHFEYLVTCVAPFMMLICLKAINKAFITDDLTC